MPQTHDDHPSPNGAAACQRLRRLCAALIPEDVPLDDALTALRSTIADALNCGLTVSQVFDELQRAGLPVSFSRFENFASNALPSATAARPSRPLTNQTDSASKLANTVSAIADLDGEFGLTGRPRDVLIVAYLLRDEINRFRQRGHTPDTICRALQDCGLYISVAELDIASERLATLRHDVEHVQRWQLVLESAGTILDCMVGLGCTGTDIKTFLERGGLHVPHGEIEAWYRTMSPLPKRRAAVVERFLTDFQLLDGHAVVAPASLNTSDGKPLRLIVLCSTVDHIIDAWPLIDALERQFAVSNRRQASSRKRQHGTSRTGKTGNDPGS
jgi:hypothetical protein